MANINYKKFARNSDYIDPVKLRRQAGAISLTSTAGVVFFLSKVLSHEVAGLSGKDDIAHMTEVAGCISHASING